MVTTHAFILHVKLGVTPVRYATNLSDLGKFINRRNIETAINLVGASTGVAAMLESLREKKRKVAEEAANKAKGYSESFSTDTEHKAKPLSVDTSYEYKQPAHGVPEDKDFSPSNGPDRGTFASSPSELDLDCANEPTFLGLLPEIDSRCLLIIAGTLIILPVIIKIIQLDLLSSLLSRLDTSRRGLTHMKNEIADHLNRALISIGVGSASALLAELAAVIAEEHGYDLSISEFLVVLVCSILIVGSCVLATMRLASKEKDANQ